jgi:hypothetical protein
MELTGQLLKAISESKKSCCNSISATVDANVNDYLKVKMHLLKTIQMVQQHSERFY